MTDPILAAVAACLVAHDVVAAEPAEYEETGPPSAQLFLAFPGQRQAGYRLRAGEAIQVRWEGAAPLEQRADILLEWAGWLRAAGFHTSELYCSHQGRRVPFALALGSHPFLYVWAGPPPQEE